MDDFVETEKSADEAEAKVQKAWQRYSTEWPERSTDALYQRIRSAQGEEVIAWMQELVREQNTLDGK